MSSAAPVQAAAIPARLNLVLLAGSVTAAGGCLYLASNGGPLALRIGAALAFSFVNNTIFSLMHEAVHGVFHPNPLLSHRILVSVTNYFCNRLKGKPVKIRCYPRSCKFSVYITGTRFSDSATTAPHVRDGKVI